MSVIGEAELWVKMPSSQVSSLRGMSARPQLGSLAVEGVYARRLDL